jgi:hypothetical protein
MEKSVVKCCGASGCCKMLIWNDLKNRLVANKFSETRFEVPIRQVRKPTPYHPVRDGAYYGVLEPSGTMRHRYTRSCERTRRPTPRMLGIRPSLLGFMRMATRRRLIWITFS